MEECGVGKPSPTPPRKLVHCKWSLPDSRQQGGLLEAHFGVHREHQSGVPLHIVFLRSYGGGVTAVLCTPTSAVEGGKPTWRVQSRTPQGNNPHPWPLVGRAHLQVRPLGHPSPYIVCHQGAPGTSTTGGPIPFLLKSPSSTHIPTRSCLKIHSIRTMHPILSQPFQDQRDLGYLPLASMINPYVNNHGAPHP